MTTSRATRPDQPAPTPDGTDGAVEHLVVMGISGSGKSTVAGILAGRLDRPFAEGDDFHPPENVETMRSGTPLTDEQRGPWLESLRDWMSDKAGAGTSTVVACSALRVPYRDVLRGAQGRVRFVHLVGEEELIAGRQAAREDHFMPPSLVTSQLETLELLGPEEDGVSVPVSEGPEQVADAVVEALAEG